MAEDIYRSIPEVVALRYKKLSDKYIRMIAKKLKEIGSVDRQDIHALLQLSMYTGDVRKIENEIAELSGMTVKELYDVFDKVAETSMAASKTVAELRGVELQPYKYNNHLQNTVATLSTLTAGTFRNISNTTAVGVRFIDRKGNVTHKTVGDPYKYAIDEAIHNVTSGLEDYDTAIAKVLKQFSDSGLRYVDYERGTSKRLDAAVRQNVLDGMRSVYQGIQNEISKQIGTDGVEISAHATCAPDHLPYQGKQYTNKEFEEIQNSLGRPFGYWNCRHSWWGIIIGISEPAYSDEQLQQMVEYSNEQISFNGKTMTRYEASQKMNELNRKASKSEDLIKLYKLEGNDKLRQHEQEKLTRYKDAVSELKKSLEREKYYMASKNDIDWGNPQRFEVTEEQIDEIIKYAKEKEITLLKSNLRKFDGDITMLYEVINTIPEFTEDFPRIKDLLERCRVNVSRKLPDQTIAVIDGNQININYKALYDRKLVKDAMNDFAGETIQDAVRHELGHTATLRYNVDTVSIVKEAYLSVYGEELQNSDIERVIEDKMSPYAKINFFGRIRGETVENIFPEFTPELLSIYKKKDPFIQKCVELTKDYKRKSHGYFRP